MKKIILILTFLFLITGCYDYEEINNLALVSAIGIDYDEKFKLTFEILNDNNKNENQEKSASSYIVKGSGKTLSTAFENISTKIDKTPYYYHLKTIIISEKVAQNNMFELIDYVTRNPEIKNEFYLTIIKDKNASEIFEKKTNESIISNEIHSLIATKKNTYNIAYDYPYEDLLEKFLNPHIDAMTTTINFKNNVIAVEGIALFKNYKYVKTLSKEESSIVNNLQGNINNILLNKKYKDKTFSVKVYFNNVSYKIKNNNLTIDITCEGEIKENESNLNLKDEKTYSKLNKTFSNILNKKIDDFIKEMQKQDIDFLGIKNIYYQKYKKNIDIKDINIDVKAKVIINKKGLIFEVKDEN